MQLLGDAGGVTCEFVRQRCTHDALFQPFYKRSNRTKGSKILRHAHRGFCGSSLHVRVELSPRRPVERRAPPAIHVFGRFRLSDTPAFPIGHSFSAASVFESVQSDDTPNGEWIKAQMIYSWSESNWLFEINNAARWFYGWESSTVKSQRLKDHVLDVYVLSASSSSSSPSSSSSSLHVVASTSSPSFQLISFRRATDDAMLALSATHHVRQQLQNGHAGLTPPLGLTQSTERMQERLDHNLNRTVHAHQPAAPLLSPAPPLLPSSAAPPPRGPLPSLRPGFSVVQPVPSARPPQWTAPPLAVAPRPHAAVSAPGSSQTAWQPQPSAVAVPRGLGAAAPTPFGSAAADKTVWEITNLLGQLHQIPLGDALERVGWMHETYAQHAGAYASSSSSPSSRSSLSSDRFKLDAERHLRRVLTQLPPPSPSSPAASRKISSRLLVTLTELALWLYFDSSTAASIQSALDEAVDSLLNSAWVRRRCGRLKFWLHDHIDHFLQLRFHTTIRDVLLECQDLGFHIQYDNRSPKTVSAPLSLTGASGTGISGGQPPKKGQDVFVAQVRELMVHQQTSSRRVRRKLGARHSPAGSSPSYQAALHRQFNAQWSCSVDQITLRRARIAPSCPATSSDLSLLSLVWFWRQFSVLTIGLSDADSHGVCRLDATSLFQSPPLGSQFVLDGADRFLRAFPAGEATLAVNVGRYSFGDYVGQYSAAVGEVQLHLYAFLSPTQLNSADDDAPLESIATDACVCYHVRLIGTPAETLVANVTVKRAALDVATLRRVGYTSARVLLEEMATWTLQQKLSAVGTWEDQYHGELVYHRV